MEDETPLDVLIGEPINAISFVMDYVELHFNGPVLTCIANPQISCGSSAWVFPEQGSRDALCKLIDARPTRIEITEGKAIVVHLDSGCNLVVPLDPGSARGGESATFVTGNNQPIQVW